jgi:hypothetical protein
MNCKECKKEYIGKEQEQTICCSCSEKKIKIGATNFILGLFFMVLAWLFVVIIFGGTYTN